MLAARPALTTTDTNQPPQENPMTDHVMPADAAFEAARQLGETITAHRAAVRQAQRDARNARRRSRYAAQPKPARATPPADRFGDIDNTAADLGCLCHLAAPCGYCTTLTDTDL
jgi:hypothetical protein